MRRREVQYPWYQMLLKLLPLSKCRTALLLALLLFAPAATFGQTAPTVSLDAKALVRRAVQHRLDAAKNHHPLRYVLHRTDDRRDTTKIIIETTEGGVARLIGINGKPLPADVDAAELQRLDDLTQHPELQEHRRKNEQKDSDRVTHLLSLLPDAFLYHYEGMVACPSGQCYRMSFIPNPHFSPPDIEANIFRGIAGEVWVDQAQECLTRLDAHFIADVDFGFGILGKISKGGSVLLEQTDIGNGDWELTNLKIHVNGKALMVKSFSYHVVEETSRFSQVSPSLKYRDAVQLLKSVDPSKTPYTP